MTNQVPTSQADSYTVPYDLFDTAALGLSGLLANDYDSDGDPLTAELVDAPAHGTITLNSNGSFVYTPTLGYVGADSFTYRASDAVAEGSTTTVSLNVVKPFGSRSNDEDQPSAPVTSQGPFRSSAQTGEVQVSHAVAPGSHLLFRSLTDAPKPIIAIEASFTSNSSQPTPSKIEARLTLNGTTGNSVFYSTSSLYFGDVVRFALQADASSLATGRYAYELTLISEYSSGRTSTQSYTGYTEIVNHSQSEFGRGWRLAELDRLIAGSGGVLFTSGAGPTGWFVDNGNGTFASPKGPLAFNTLVRNADGSYTLTDKLGSRSEFSSSGLLTARVDANGNTTTYTYVDADGDGQADELSQITDPYSRTTTFTYTSGRLSSVTDFAGRVTSVAYDASDRVTSITAPDPDGAGAQTSPVTSFGYTSGFLASITDPRAYTTQLQYNFAGRLSQSTKPDTNTQEFQAVQTAGLVDTSSGSGSSSNPAPIYRIDSPYIPLQATWTDENGNPFSILTDRFGYTTRYTDQLGNVTSYQRDANGLVTEMTRPDPDGSGSLTAPVTSYQYDAMGNRLQITHPDNSTETWATVFR